MARGLLKIEIVGFMGAMWIQGRDIFLTTEGGDKDVSQDAME